MMQFIIRHVFYWNDLIISLNFADVSAIFLALIIDCSRSLSNFST